MLNQQVREVLGRVGLTRPDGRPLHAYGCTVAEMERLAGGLRLALARATDFGDIAPAFVLWSAEHIRLHHLGGQLTWALIYNTLSVPEDRSSALKLVERGLLWWERQVRVSAGGNRMFLYSLMAEGGLPDALLAAAGLYREVVIAMVREIEADGVLGPSTADVVAERHIQDLPQVYRTDDTARLLADLAVAIVGLRQALPDDLPIEAAERWLDAHKYGWRDALPLRLSPEALTALVRPVLIAEPAGRPRPLAPLVRRELRRRVDGNGWTGVTVVGNGGFLPALLLPGVDEDLRLRFLPRTPTDNAVVSLLGIPEGGGWRLLRVIGQGDVELSLAPEESLALSAYADGHLVGEAVVDAGLPALAEAPRLWRSAEASSEKTVRLLPLSESGRTRGAQVWLQATKEAEPKSLDGVSVGPAECVSDGRLWPLNGQGEIEVGGVRLRVLTGAEVDEEHAQLLTSGRPLVGWRAVHGMQLLCGTPVFWGSSGGTPLRRLWRDVEMRQIPSVLCGQIAEWRRDGQVVARLRTIILPEALALCLRETRPGVAVLQGQGLVAGWHVALLAAGADERAVSDANGRVVLTLTVRDAVPGLVRLRLSEPVTGEALMLEAPWPARTAMLVDPSGVRLQRNRAIACASLSGWRGFVPVGGGTLQLRVANDRATVGMKVEGEVRLAAHEALWRSILALAGPDARVNLRLIAGGDAGHRLELGRYDWQAEIVGYCCRLGDGRAILHAVTLEEPLLVKTRAAEHEFDLSEWLGKGPNLWFIQGRSDKRGIMRPFAWSPVPARVSTREQRVGRYAANWLRLLKRPTDPTWAHSWTLIAAAREGGDAGALDQVQALRLVPAAAVTLLFRVREGELAEAVALEDAAPIWWPLVTCSDWAAGLGVDLARQRMRFHEAGFDSDEAERESQKAVARRVWHILTLRPELQGHLCLALERCGLQPFALPKAADDPVLPLRLAEPRQLLEGLSHEAAKRFSHLPDGFGQAVARRLSVGRGFNPALRPLLDAPLVVAEVAVGWRPQPTLRETLHILSLRLADPVWFDAALPPAISLAREEQENV